MLSFSYLSLTSESQNEVSCEVESGMAGEYDANQYYYNLTSDGKNIWK
jgi:hypothetical protein